MAACQSFRRDPLDEVSCPELRRHQEVPPSKYAGKPGGNPPAAYGFPTGVRTLGSPPERAAISNYVALAATHFTCMQYGPMVKLAATTDDSRRRRSSQWNDRAGHRAELEACTDGASQNPDRSARRSSRP